MKNSEKKRQQLLEEIAELRARLGRMEDAEAKRKPIEQRSRIILQTAMDGFCIVDTQGNFKGVNEAYCRITGYTRDELLSMNVKDIEALETIVETAEHLKKIKKSSVERFETSLKRKDGGRVDVEVSVNYMPSDSGQLFAVVRDITARKQAEQALRQSERDKALILGSLSELISYQDKSLRVVWANKAAGDSVGQSPDELVGRYCYEIWHGRQEPCMVCPIQKSFKTRKPEQGEVTSPDRRVWYISGCPVLNEQGEVTGAVEVTLEITKHRQAEETLRESKNLLQTVINSTKDAMISIGEDGLITLFNPAAEEMFGRKRAKMIGRSLDCLMPKEYRRRHREYIKSYFSTGKPDGAIGKVVELPGLHRDGHVFPIAISLSRGELDNKQFVIAVARDITERKETEKILQESETRYRMVVEDQTELICRFMPEGVLTFVNDAYCRYFGRKHEELVGHSFMPLILEEDRNKVNNQISRLDKENSTVTTEHRVIAQGGSIRWQQWTNRAIFDEQDNIIEYQAVGRDVTERKEAAETLEYWMNFEKLITNISTNFINLSAEEVDNGINQALKALGEFADVDRSYVFQFSDDGNKTSNTHEWCADGITPQIDNLQNISVDSTPWWIDKLRKFETIHIPDVEKLPARAKNEKEILQAQSIKSLIAIPMVYNRWLIGFMGFDSVRRKRTWSGEIITLLTIVSEIFVNTLMRKRTQQELDEYHEKMFRAEQLASLGTLSATIAHELNQPLTVIKLFLQQSLRAIGESGNIDKVVENITDSLSEISKAAATVDRFRKFARKSSPVDISEVNIVQIANRIVGVLTESACRTKLNLSVNVKGCPSHILGNVVEFEQIFFVLIQNAIHAADGKGWRDLKITISSQDSQLQLTFADTCGGIDPEHIDRIFEPFFTTKPADIGTGLGLCILERIVKRYNGSVRVESKPGHGTIFYVCLLIRD
jgi:PAS domain S-box-containing protein